MSDLSCLWKVHTFPLIAVYQPASFCLWILRWNSSFVSARADVLEMTRLICEDEQNSRTSARRAAPTNCVIFWDCCLLALFYTSGREGKLPFSASHFCIWKKCHFWYRLRETESSPSFSGQWNPLKPHFSKSPLSLFWLQGMLFDVGFQLKTKH